MIDVTKIEAVLFDMDGTLVDTEPVGPETMRSFLDKNNVVMDKNDWGLFDKVWRRDGTKITFEEFVTNILKKYSNIVEIDKCISDFYHDYENNILLAKPLMGTHEALLYLKSKYKLALVTASTASQAKLILKNNNWEHLFDVVISHDDFIKSKPDPESFLATANKLTTSPEKCAVVEDSRNGSLAGKNAGMVVVGVRAGNEYEQDLSIADVVIDTLNDIKKVL